MRRQRLVRNESIKKGHPTPCSTLTAVTLNDFLWGVLCIIRQGSMEWSQHSQLCFICIFNWRRRRLYVCLWCFTVQRKRNILETAKLVSSLGGPLLPFT